MKLRTSVEKAADFLGISQEQVTDYMQPDEEGMVDLAEVSRVHETTNETEDVSVPDEEPELEVDTIDPDEELPEPEQDEVKSALRDAQAFADYWHRCPDDLKVRFEAEGAGMAYELNGARVWLSLNTYMEKRGNAEALFGIARKKAMEQQVPDLIGRLKAAGTCAFCDGVNDDFNAEGALRTAIFHGHVFPGTRRPEKGKRVLSLTSDHPDCKVLAVELAKFLAEVQDEPDEAVSALLDDAIDTALKAVLGVEEFDIDDPRVGQLTDALILIINKLFPDKEED